MLKTEPICLVLVGLMTGRPADEKLVVLEIFKIRQLYSRHVFRLFESIFSLGKVVSVHLWTVFCDSIVLRFFQAHFWEAIVFLDNPYY